MMGDFVKGRLPDAPTPALDAALLEGIRMHREVDSYTDRHPRFAASRARLSAPLRRYGGIIVDVFYDHYLARRWQAYSDRPLAEFCSSVYATLQSYYHAMPTPMQHSVRHMIDHDWLRSYRHIDGVTRSLAGIEKRFKRPPRRAVTLSSARRDLERFDDAFGADFEHFFADLCRFAAARRALAAARLAAASRGAAPAN